MNLAKRLLAAMATEKKRVLVIGDAIADLWVHGRVEKCQDDCPKFVEESRLGTPGGAANAHACLQNWVDLDDWTARSTLHTYDREHQPMKCRFVGPAGQILMRWDDDAARATERRSYKWAQTYIIENVKTASAVLLSDYDKGFLSEELIGMVVKECAERRIPCVADAKRRPESYAGAIIKANMNWYLQYGGCEVVTRGDHQPRVKGGSWPRRNLPAVECVNHVGAGDCFAAHLTLALAHGFSLEDAATLAHSAGRVYVQHKHNRPPLPAEIEADLEGGCVTTSGISPDRRSAR